MSRDYKQNKKSVLYTALPVKDMNSNCWYIDSGESAHMTMQSMWFVEEPTQFNEEVGNL